MTLRSTPRSSHRLIAVISSFSLVAGIGVAVIVGQSLADGPTPMPRLSLGPNLIENSGFGSGLDSWSRSQTDASLTSIVQPGVAGSAHAVQLRSQSLATVVLRDERTTAPQSDKGTVYQASAWMRATSGPVSGRFKVYEWKNNAVVNVTTQRFTVIHEKWERITLVATAEADLSGLQLSMSAFRLNLDRGIKIDRIHLHPVKGANPSESPTPLPDPTEPDGDPTATPTASPTPTPTNTETAPSSPNGTLYGASVFEDGRGWEAAVDESDAAYGGMDVVRVFYPGLPSAWPGRAGMLDRPVVVSFKAAPAAVLAGRYDAFFADWFLQAPDEHDIWWAYWHEPENDVERGVFKSEQWRDAYRHIAGFADAADNPKLHNTIILMCWTLNPNSGRNFANYFPGSDVVETLAWDCYSHPSDPTAYSTAPDMYARAVAKSDELGIPFGIAETGSRLAQGDSSGEKRAEWLRYIGNWIGARDAAFMSYFDSYAGGEFRLLDEPSRSAWHEVVTTY